MGKYKNKPSGLYRFRDGVRCCAGPAPRSTRATANLRASLENGKWYLTAETSDGDKFLELAWPWPGEEKSKLDLINAGFLVT